MRHKMRRCGGETLVETLAAVLIITLSSLVLVTSAVTAMRINRSTADSDRSFEEEQKTAEEQPPDGASDGTVTVTDASGNHSQYAVQYSGGGGKLTSYAFRRDAA